jgi:hypothetical protein
MLLLLDFFTGCVKNGRFIAAPGWETPAVPSL